MKKKNKLVFESRKKVAKLKSSFRLRIIMRTFTPYIYKGNERWEFILFVQLTICVLKSIANLL